MWSQLMQRTAPVKHSKRKAREERLIGEFQALEDFANLGDTIEDWRRFRLKWPHFFPDYLTQWIYDSAKCWKVLSGWPETRPDNYREMIPPGFRRVSDAPKSPISMEEWARNARHIRSQMREVRPSLIYFRILMRLVWKRKDTDGRCLKGLLGFDADMPYEELEEEDQEVTSLFALPGRPKTEEEIEEEQAQEAIDYLNKHATERGLPKATMKRTDRETFGGLPAGRPLVNGITGIITWEFGCQFQRTVYDLMRDRWRAKVCQLRNCGKYFIADKGARKYCSPECYAERKEEQSLEYYYSKGKAARQAKALRSHREPA